MNIDQFMLGFLQRKESLFAADLRAHDTVLKKEIEGKKIMVIGGAGTIGSSFIKAALRYRPAAVVVVDINENALTELVRDVRSTRNQYVPDAFYTYPLSFDNPAFFKLFRAHGPFDIVANFAAHKHVRSEKDIYSIEALLENNLIKAKSLLDFLVQHPPAHFFCVSTDKAANPVNIMGASKKMMEEMILSYTKHFPVTTARFANVAFSNGSLMEGFLKRMERRQPISCPEDVTRFFVAPVESGEICLAACVLGNSAEIFFPKLDMQKDLIRFADVLPAFLKEKGFNVYRCNSEEEARNSTDRIDQGEYPVYFFKTDTSGEKLYEEFYTEEETYTLDRYRSLGVISKTAQYTPESFHGIIDELKQLLADPVLTKQQLVIWLKKYIPEFDHIETGLGLDKKM
jgi:FlaA1/EpsC-like NDP-sugar epimerase